MSNQFIRLEPYSQARAASILAEAAREPEFCQHVREASTPRWILGSQEEVLFAIETYMAQSVPIRYPNGAVGMRKQRPGPPLPRRRGRE